MGSLVSIVCVRRLITLEGFEIFLLDFSEALAELESGKGHNATVSQLDL